MATDITAAANLGLATPATMASGAFTSTGNATSVTLGFTPRWARVYDETGVVIWEKQQGDVPANTWKQAAGGLTLDTATAIGFPTDPGLAEPGNTMLLSAALCGTGKVISWVAIG